ncbi:adenylate/guanylate cyclase domain-containing protein [Chitinibacter bivalviorum]|uniref:Adenylate/guanylate cyclase domain-containing protein n=1 Tax=Chitinibacter bivalviorum TaxID=2739434 RepID=A0A7H9BKC4_9NEIS|nr:adenylate/guanylate cyclase domain-containing protein [Chitinibacter bivalviorum]QLG88939.1 adenylate/guanylate cyclase domain-containing protein [Chitinibacter bivalviorum]
MPTFKPRNADYVRLEVDGRRRKLLTYDAFDQFNASLLGLGDLTRRSKPIDALAAVFDLEDFTQFCKQIDPHLSVPNFLHPFLNWLMEQLRNEMKQKDEPEGVALWCPLPFFIKFMGDGLLVMWDCNGISPVSMRNVIASAWSICKKYQQDFLPTLKSLVVDPPTRLRCGLARGTVFSVGEGHDYVGSCINMAARVQKLPGVGFAFNRRGFDLEDERTTSFFTDHIITREITIRGIGESELVCILRSEYEKMKVADKKLYRTV